MYFLVDRTGQQFFANPPGNVTRNGVNGKGKKVTFAMNNTPDPEPVPRSKSPPPSPLKNTKTRGQITPTQAPEGPRARIAACLASPVGAPPEETATTDGPPRAPEQRQAGRHGQRDQQETPPTVCSEEGDMTPATKKQTHPPKLKVWHHVNSHPPSSHTKAEKEILLGVDEAHDECDEGECVSLMQKIALGPKPPATHESQKGGESKNVQKRSTQPRPHVVGGGGASEAPKRRSTYFLVHTLWETNCVKWDIRL